VFFSEHSVVPDIIERLKASA